MSMRHSTELPEAKRTKMLNDPSCQLEDAFQFLEPDKKQKWKKWADCLRAEDIDDVQDLAKMQSKQFKKLDGKTTFGLMCVLTRLRRLLKDTRGPNQNSKAAQTNKKAHSQAVQSKYHFSSVPKPLEVLFASEFV